jgi:hypothetical protein
VPEQQVEIVDDPAEERYEARVDGKLAGSAVYHLRPGQIVFLHTESTRPTRATASAAAWRRPRWTTPARRDCAS